MNHASALLARLTPRELALARGSLLTAANISPFPEEVAAIRAVAEVLEHAIGSRDDRTTVRI